MEAQSPISAPILLFLLVCRLILAWSDPSRIPPVVRLYSLVIPQDLVEVATRSRATGTELSETPTTTLPQPSRVKWEFLSPTVP